MLLVCPNCSTRFKVKAEALGDAGRKVKCAKCGNQWHATKGDLIDPAADKGVKEPPPKPPAPPPPPPPKPDPEPEPTPPAMEDTPVVAPEAPAAPDPMAAPAPPMDDDPYEKDDAPPPPPPPMMDNLDPPPIPREEDFKRPRKVTPDKRKSPLGAWIGLAVLVVVVCASGFFFSKEIVKAYPPAHAIYQALGLQIETLGDGLELREQVAVAEPDATPRRLSMEGQVYNTTSQPIQIPLLSGSLLDANGAVLLTWIFEAEKPDVFPGEAVIYKTFVEDPPAGAASIEMTFVTKEEAMAAGYKGAMEGEAMSDKDEGS